MWFDEMDTPIGPLRLGADEQGLRYVMFAQNKHLPISAKEQGEFAPARLSEARMQLAQYFAGQRRDFNLTLAPLGTEFQRQVWHALAQIKFGETWSYGQLARYVGRERAVRAVGAANGRNPLPIILPCHRVIGADGSLTGFGGGLPRKQWLLQHELVLPQSADLFAQEANT